MQLKRSFLFTFFLFIGAGLLQAQQISQSLSFSAAQTAPPLYIGNGINFHLLRWVSVNAGAACSIRVDSGPTANGPWTAGGVVAPQACQNSGSAALVTAAWNYALVNLTNSGNGTVTFTYMGFFTMPSLTGGGGVNLTQVGGSPVGLGQTTMANSLPVSLASNQSSLPVMLSGTSSPVKTEDFASANGDWGSFTLGVRNDGGNTITTSANGDYAQVSVDGYGVLWARSDHPNRINCLVPVSTATTLQAVGGSCVAPGAGLSIYISDIEFGTSAAAGTAADSFPTLKSGTGGTCGTGTAIIWQALTGANTTAVTNSTIPIKVAANSEVCWIMSTAGSKILQIRGFIAP